MTTQHTRTHKPIVAAAALSLLMGAFAPIAAYAADGAPSDPANAQSATSSQSNGGSTASSAGDSSQSEDKARSADAAQPVDAAQSADRAQSTPEAPLNPPLTSLDFDGIIPDDAKFLVPRSADRFKQDDGTYKIGAPLPGGPGAGSVVPGLEAFYNQKIEWGPCGDFEPSGAGEWAKDSTAQCGYLIVPVDYSKPNGATIAIGLYKVPATNQAQKIGTLFADPGGPGGSGMSMAHGYGEGASGVVAERFDYIGFDPRGVGSSLPMIRCQSASAFDKQRQDDDFYTAEQRDAITRYNTEQCYSNTGSQFNISGEDFIGSVGTVNVVRDLDIARAAVGDKQINFLGYSYGTSIGYHYARQFPNNVRTMIIDGVVNPFENNEEGGEQYKEYTESTSSGLSSDLAQMQGFQATFEQFLKTCAQENGFELQGIEFPCATGTDPDVKTAMANYHKIARTAWQNPELKTSDGRVLSFYDMSQATILSMYSESIWKYLNYALLQLRDAQNPDIAMFLADHYYDRSAEGTYEYGTMAAFPTIWCADYGTPEGGNAPEALLKKKKDIFEIAPFMDPGLNPDGTQRGLRPEVDWCTYYHNTHTLPKGENLAALPNILVISTTYDPSTPYQDGVVAADAIDGTLLTVAGNDHTAFKPGAGDCVAQISEQYLVSMTVPTDITGEKGVETKDLKSNVITGNQCRVDSFRPTPALQSIATNPGFGVEVMGNGLVRNTAYVLTVAEGLGVEPITAVSNELGEITFDVPVGANVEPATYSVSLAPADLTLNDPTVAATGEIKVLPFLVKEHVEQVLQENLFIEKPIFDLKNLEKKTEQTTNPKAAKGGKSLAGTGADNLLALLAASGVTAGLGVIAYRRRKH